MLIAQGLFYRIVPNKQGKNRSLMITVPNYKNKFLFLVLVGIVKIWTYSILS
jgi:hypothetical protein